MITSIVTLPDDDGNHPELAQAQGLSCRDYLRFRLNAKYASLPVLPKELAWEAHRKADLHHSCTLVTGLERMANAAHTAAEGLAMLRRAAKHASTTIGRHATA